MLQTSETLYQLHLLISQAIIRQGVFNQSELTLKGFSMTPTEWREVLAVIESRLNNIISIRFNLTPRASEFIRTYGIL